MLRLCLLPARWHQEGMTDIIWMITVVSSSPDLCDFISLVDFRNVRCANIGLAAMGPVAPAPAPMYLAGNCPLHDQDCKKMSLPIFKWHLSECLLNMQCLW